MAMAAAAGMSLRRDLTNNTTGYSRWPPTEDERPRRGNGIVGSNLNLEQLCQEIESQSIEENNTLKLQVEGYVKRFGCFPYDGHSELLRSLCVAIGNDWKILLEAVTVVDKVTLDTIEYTFCNQPPEARKFECRLQVGLHRAAESQNLTWMNILRALEKIRREDILRELTSKENTEKWLRLENSCSRGDIFLNDDNGNLSNRNPVLPEPARAAANCSQAVNQRFSRNFAPMNLGSPFGHWMTEDQMARYFQSMGVISPQQQMQSGFNASNEAGTNYQSMPLNMSGPWSFGIREQSWFPPEYLQPTNFPGYPPMWSNGNSLTSRSVPIQQIAQSQSLPNIRGDQNSAQTRVGGGRSNPASLPAEIPKAARTPDSPDSDNSLGSNSSSDGGFISNLSATSSSSSAKIWVLLTYSIDAQEEAHRLRNYLKNERFGVVTVDELKLMQNDTLSETLQKAFKKVKYIIPILSPQYLLDIQGEDSPNSIELSSVKSLYTLYQSNYFHEGSRNRKVRPVNLPSVSYKQYCDLCPCLQQPFELGKQMRRFIHLLKEKV